MVGLLCICAHSNLVGQIYSALTFELTQVWWGYFLSCWFSLSCSFLEVISKQKFFSEAVSSLWAFLRKDGGTRNKRQNGSAKLKLILRSTIAYFLFDLLLNPTALIYGNYWLICSYTRELIAISSWVFQWYSSWLSCSGSTNLMFTFLLIISLLCSSVLQTVLSIYVYLYSDLNLSIAHQNYRSVNCSTVTLQTLFNEVQTYWTSTFRSASLVPLLPVSSGCIISGGINNQLHRTLSLYQLP